MLKGNPFASRLVGHESMLDSISRLTAADRLPHAVLFTGPEGVGKRLVAYAAAAAILERHAPDPQKTFAMLSGGSHPDLHLLVREEEKKDISVEGVRELRSRLQLQPFSGSAAVAVIDDAHHLNIAASNALLLTLEEPAAGRYLFLVTHAPQKLPETIVSRCQTVRFAELSEQQIGTILKQLFPKIEQKQLALLLTLTGGSLAPLALSEFIDPRTLRISSEADCWKHLGGILDRTKQLDRSLRRIFSAEPLPPGDALSVASLIAEEKGDELSWLLLRQAARRALREAGGDPARQAELLLRTLEAERLVRERNASPQLQLSSLFLEASDIPRR